MVLLCLGSQEESESDFCSELIEALADKNDELLNKDFERRKTSLKLEEGYERKEHVLFL